MFTMIVVPSCVSEYLTFNIVLVKLITSNGKVIPSDVTVTVLSFLNQVPAKTLFFFKIKTKK